MSRPVAADNSPALLYLDKLRSSFASVDRILGMFGRASLGEYLDSFPRPVSNPLQPRKDLYPAIMETASPILGEQVARSLCADLEEDPVILTLNHHGSDSFCITFQAALFFALAKRVKKRRLRTAPIFSCSSISMDNPSYPRGILVYAHQSSIRNGSPTKIPVFPAKYKSQLIRLMSPMQEDMLIRTQKTVAELGKSGAAPRAVVSGLKELINNCCMHPQNLELANYSRQATYINHCIAQNITASLPGFPSPVYLDLELISGKLLGADLKNRESLAWKCLFDPMLREKIMHSLDQAPACWDVGQLRESIPPKRGSSFKKTNHSPAGTMFFWGVDEKGKRIPLYLNQKDARRPVLQGRDMSGRIWEYSFSADEIAGSLHSERLVPSLFLCFLVLSFARGMICVGGLYQTDYLKNMQDKLIKCLKETEAYQGIAEKIAQIPSRTYLDNMVGAAALLDPEHVVPAGPVELLAARGLTEQHITRMLNLSVNDAHMAGLFETVNDLDQPDQPSIEEKRELIKDISNRLRSSLTIIDYT